MCPISQPFSPGVCRGGYEPCEWPSGTWGTGSPWSLFLVSLLAMGVDSNPQCSLIPATGSTLGFKFLIFLSETLTSMPSHCESQAWTPG